MSVHDLCESALGSIDDLFRGVRDAMPDGVSALGVSASYTGLDETVTVTVRHARRCQQRDAVRSYAPSGDVVWTLHTWPGTPSGRVYRGPTLAGVVAEWAESLRGVA